MVTHVKEVRVHRCNERNSDSSCNIRALHRFVGRCVSSFHSILPYALVFLYFRFFVKTSWGGITYKSLLKKKLRTILLPQVTLAILNISVVVIFDVLLKHRLHLSEVDFVSPFGNWFLITLFLMEMIAVPVITLIRDKKFLSLITCVIFVAFCCVSYKEIMYVQQTLAALVFGLLGYLCRPLLDVYSTNKYNFSGFGWIVLLITAMCSMCNEPIGMYINQYGYKILFLAVALLGIFSLSDISVSLQNTGFIQWCGKHSIILYILHPLVIKVVINLSSMFFSSFVYSRYPYYIFTFLVVMVILVPLASFCDKNLKFAFGK